MSSRVLPLLILCALIVSGCAQTVMLLPDRGSGASLDRAARPLEKLRGEVEHDLLNADFELIDAAPVLLEYEGAARRQSALEILNASSLGTKPTTVAVMTDQVRFTDRGTKRFASLQVPARVISRSSGDVLAYVPQHTSEQVEVSRHCLGGPCLYKPLARVMPDLAASFSRSLIAALQGKGVSNPHTGGGDPTGEISALGEETYAYAIELYGAPRDHLAKLQLYMRRVFSGYRGLVTEKEAAGPVRMTYNSRLDTAHLIRNLRRVALEESWSVSVEHQETRIIIHFNASETQRRKRNDHHDW